MKSVIAAVVIVAGTYGAAGAVQEALDVLVPETARVVSDVSLKSMYTEAYAMHIQGVPMREALHLVAEGFSQEDGISYVVENGELVARTDWSCRRLVVGDFAATVQPCR
jgi:hypothetical protein